MSVVGEIICPDVCAQVPADFLAHLFDYSFSSGNEHVVQGEPKGQISAGESLLLLIPTSRFQL